MTNTITPLIVGNWKMNGLMASLDELASLAKMLAAGTSGAVVVICPPATILAAFARQGAASGILAGGQDCHAAAHGAYTGDISARMLVDAGAQYVIVGHSERRAAYGEGDADICAKAEAAIEAGLKPIICVGETEAQRKAGKAGMVVDAQLANAIPDAAGHNEVVVAYEPIWAIGTGRTPGNEDIARMHNAIRKNLQARFGDKGSMIRILYGGSMKPHNAREILTINNVNGGLVGGASLSAKEFAAIIAAA